MSDLSNLVILCYIFGDFTRDMMYHFDVYIDSGKKYIHNKPGDIFNNSHYQSDCHTFMKKKGIPYMRKAYKK